MIRLTRRAVSSSIVAAIVAGCTQDEALLPPPPRRLIADAELRPWPEAAEARLFVQTETHYDDGSWVDPKGRRLSKDERAELERHLRLRSYDRQPDSEAACFIPHHFLRYYTGSGEQIGEVAVCFCCTGISQTPAVEHPLPKGATDDELGFTDGLEPAIAALGYETQVGC